MLSPVNFHQKLAAFVLAETDMPPPDGQMGFRVHRNTVLKGLLDALAANYPVTRQLLGEACFTALGLRFVRTHWPRCASLNLYGAEFAGWLNAHAELKHWPFVPAVARLERLWTESYFAADAPTLDVTAFASDLASRAEQRLVIHPATRFAWLPNSALTVWRHHQSPEGAGELSIDLEPQGVLVVRESAGPIVFELTRSEYALLEAIEEFNLGEVAAEFMCCDPDFDVSGTLAALIRVGVFAESI